jgi:hypothetical protein
MPLDVACDVCFVCLSPAGLCLPSTRMKEKDRKGRRKKGTMNGFAKPREKKDTMNGFAKPREDLWLAHHEVRLATTGTILPLMTLLNPDLLDLMLPEPTITARACVCEDTRKTTHTHRKRNKARGPYSASYACFQDDITRKVLAVLLSCLFGG